MTGKILCKSNKANKEESFRKFYGCLKKACSNVGKDYFELKQAGSEIPVLRERVYCYELYHQLRLCLRNNSPYMLAGEVDKRAHPIIKDNNVPDFIFHVSGNMKYNLVIMEVKSTNGIIRDYEGLKRDLEKLYKFITKYCYYRGILLIFGNKGINSKDRIGDIVNRVINCRLDDELIENMLFTLRKKILVLWHREQGKEPEEIIL